VTTYVQVKIYAVCYIFINEVYVCLSIRKPDLRKIRAERSVYSGTQAQKQYDYSGLKGLTIINDILIL
jgi:hypothetical protein